MSLLFLSCEFLPFFLSSPFFSFLLLSSPFFSFLLLLLLLLSSLLLLSRSPFLSQTILKMKLKIIKWSDVE